MKKSAGRKLRRNEARANRRDVSRKLQKLDANRFKPHNRVKESEKACQ